MATSPVLPKLVGERVKRREDPRLIQGKGTFVDDIKIVGMQHLALSPVSDSVLTDVGAAVHRTGMAAVRLGR
jgi:carbon-monoxide dehydrogenase large subunit